MSDTNDKISVLDAAIAAAKARKDAKAQLGNGTATVSAKAEKPAKAPKASKITEDVRAARKAKIEEDRAARKAAKDAEKAAIKAAKLAERANKAPAHMQKVLKAAEKLPSLNETAQIIFGDATANLTSEGIAALALHLQHFNRVKATERALNTTISVDDTVRIVGGDPRYVGMVGTVTRAQRIRCYVEVEDLGKELYLFTSDVEKCEIAKTVEDEETQDSEETPVDAVQELSEETEEEEELTGTDD